MPTTSSRWWNNCWQRLPGHERSRVAPYLKSSMDGKAGARMSRIEFAKKSTNGTRQAWAYGEAAWSTCNCTPATSDWTRVRYWSMCGAIR